MKRCDRITYSCGVILNTIDLMNLQRIILRFVNFSFCFAFSPDFNRIIDSNTLVLNINSSYSE